MREYFVDDAGVIWPVYNRENSPYCQYSPEIEIRTEVISGYDYVQISFVDVSDEGRVIDQFVLHESLTKLAEVIESKC